MTSHTLLKSIIPSVNEEAPANSDLTVTKWWLVWTAIGFLVLMTLMILLLNRWGLLDEQPTPDGTSLLAAVLSLVGTGLTGSLTFVGLLLRLAQQERTVQLTREAEERLRLEAALRAVQLMGTDNQGCTASKVRVAGALLLWWSSARNGLLSRCSGIFGPMAEWRVQPLANS